MKRQTSRFAFRGAICLIAVFAFVPNSLMEVEAAASAPPAPATYRVTLLEAGSPKLTVVADLPIDGSALTMATTRPGGIPELDARGWPALISNLHVKDVAGGSIETTSAGEPGWQLTQPITGRVTVQYDVDYAVLAARGWPAPREAAFSDEDDLVLVGRSLFITTAAVGASRVAFDLPRGWRPVTPWEPKPGSSTEFAVVSEGDLVENLLVLSRSTPDVVTAGDLRLLVTPLGHWKPARREVRRVLGAAIPRLTALVRDDEKANYLVVLLPTLERGGESYRHSFALTTDVPPSRADSAVWGNLIAHEVFHLWNGWRLQGADYATSQWFQEGFTEYAANVSMVAGKLISQAEFLQLLSDHVTKYRKLTTTLEAGGSRKGPPLYSGGALVAFSWDVRIRQATGGERNLWDFVNVLYHQTGWGERPYAWADIRQALRATAPLDWDASYRLYIQGDKPLPLNATLWMVGLRLAQAQDGAPRIEVDAAAPTASKKLWRELVQGR